MAFFEEDQLTSVISLFIEHDEIQFRKFATVKKEQGKGYGSKLLHHVINQAMQMGVKRIWCSARQDKLSFYKKFGLEETNGVFDKGGIRYIVMEKRIDYSE